jgi:hypothetical protein
MEQAGGGDEACADIAKTVKVIAGANLGRKMHAVR